VIDIHRRRSKIFVVVINLCYEYTKNNLDQVTIGDGFDIPVGIRGQVVWTRFRYP
jgi:phosphomevalonate kinase